MRAIIQNPMRLPVTLMIVLLQAGTWILKSTRVLKPHPALYDCVGGGLWAGAVWKWGLN